MTKVYIPQSAGTTFINYLTWLPDVEYTKNLGEADLVLFAGGEDVTPILYGQYPNKYTRTNIYRDINEIRVFNYARRKNLKILGICRGSQFTTVMSGGSLLQHVGGHTQPHTTFLTGGQVIEVMSTHHQMMNPYVLDRDEYKLIGVGEGIVDSYVDGRHEVVPLDKDFLEPEIVYYPKTNVLAIQGHPEQQVRGEEHKDYLEAQVEIFKAFMNDKMEDYVDYRDEQNDS